METVKFMYLQDPDVPERVVTLARMLVGGRLRVSWCVNRVREENRELRVGKSRIHEYRLVIEDCFNKETARKITTGRLKSTRQDRYIEIEVPEGSKNLNTMLEVIPNDLVIPWIVRDVVLRCVEEREAEKS